MSCTAALQAWPVKWGISGWKGRPFGYGKYGSFEGLLQRRRIAKLGRMMAEEALRGRENASFCQSEAELDSISCKSIAGGASDRRRAGGGDFDIVGTYLGRGAFRAHRYPESGNDSDWQYLRQAEKRTG